MNDDRKIQEYKLLGFSETEAKKMIKIDEEVRNEDLRKNK